MKRFNKIEKIKWLQKNYKPYSVKWYSENDGRLSAIFNTQYQKYLKSLVKGTNDEQKAYMDSLADRLRQAYKKHYRSDYDCDFQLDRQSTHAKAMAIRAFWAKEPLAI